jgi:hypothetical protein
MKKFVHRLKTNIIIRIFWSDALDEVRRNHYKMAEDQGIIKGKRESQCENCINQMEGLINEN